MPSTSCNSNIIALQRQFPNILRKGAEGVTVHKLFVRVSKINRSSMSPRYYGQSL